MGSNVSIFYERPNFEDEASLWWHLLYFRRFRLLHLNQ